MTDFDYETAAYQAVEDLVRNALYDTINEIADTLTEDDEWMYSANAYAHRTMEIYHRPYDYWDGDPPVTIKMPSRRDIQEAAFHLACLAKKRAQEPPRLYYGLPRP